MMDKLARTLFVPRLGTVCTLLWYGSYLSMVQTVHYRGTSCTKR